MTWPRLSQDDLTKENAGYKTGRLQSIKWMFFRRIAPKKHPKKVNSAVMTEPGSWEGGYGFNFDLPGNLVKALIDLADKA